MAPVFVAVAANCSVPVRDLMGDGAADDAAATTTLFAIFTLVSSS
jgi:hypothetical protein